MIQVRPCNVSLVAVTSRRLARYSQLYQHHRYYPWLFDKLAATGSFACAGRSMDSSLQPRLLQHMQLSAGRDFVAKDGEVRNLEGEEV